MTPKTTPTIYDVARMAGVSTATVSRVVNRHDCIREETLQRVKRVIAELNYQPDPFAQKMARMAAEPRKGSLDA
jgi:LacI family transcriptional regulator